MFADGGCFSFFCDVVQCNCHPVAAPPPLVLDLSLRFSVAAHGFLPIFVCEYKIANIRGAVASISGRLLSSCPAVHPVFWLLLHASA